MISPDGRALIRQHERERVMALRRVLVDRTRRLAGIAAEREAERNPNKLL